MYALQKFYLLPMVLVIASTVIWGKRPFDVQLDAYDCSYNPVYIKYMNCVTDRKLNMANVSFGLKRDINDFKFSFEVVLYKKNTENFTLLNTTINDGCEFLEGKVRMTLLNIAKETLAKAGTLPSKCPISKDFLFEFKNLSIDVERFPTYLPERKFHATLVTRQGGNFIFSLEIGGEVVQKLKNMWGLINFNT